MNISSTTDSNGSNTKKRARRKVLAFSGIVKDFAIDEDDYGVIRELLLDWGWDDENVIQKLIMSSVKIEEDDKERRVCNFCMRHVNAANLRTIPPSIGRLQNLKELDLCGLTCTLLPPSIGKLQNLTILDLSFSSLLSNLPEEIGDLASLEELHLRFSSGLTSLPPSIGRLQNLRYLDLNGTNSLLKLPEEIGDLANLDTLKLHGSAITLLPPSIGQSQNLKHLGLSQTENLLQLPEEIGELASLEELDLHSSGITSLPTSIGRLQNLKDLNLSWIESLLELPEEIGDLASLNKLNLNNSLITSLPPSIGRLQNLYDLDLSHTSFLLPKEIGELVSLTNLNLYSICEEDERGENKIFFALACNGARSRTRSIRTVPKLWPRMLNNATRAFSGFHRSPYKTYSVQKPDAIYQLLIIGRESFIRLIGNRNTRDFLTSDKGDLKFEDA